MKTNLRKRVLSVLLVLAMLLSVLPMGALAEETYTDVELTYKDNSNGLTFNVDDTTSISGYSDWKQLNLTVQVQYGTTSEEAAAAELVDYAAYFAKDGNLLHLYITNGTTTNYTGKCLKVVIPAGTIVTPADNAGSTAQMRITNEIVLERLSTDWKTDNGWVVKESVSEDETFVDVVLSFQDTSNGFIFNVDNTAGISQYTEWKNLNLVVQCRYADSAAGLADAKLSQVQARFNRWGNKLCLYDAQQYKGIELVIPAGTIITPADDAGSNVKLRVTNEVVLKRAPSLYGTEYGWVQQVDQLDPIDLQMSLYSTNGTADWCFTPSVALASTGFYLTDAIIDGVETAVAIEYTSWDSGKMHIWSNTFAPCGSNDKNVASMAPTTSFVIPAGTTLTPITTFANQITQVAGGQPYVLTQEFKLVNASGWKQVETEAPDETYIDIELTYRDNSNGMIFDVPSSVKLAETYGSGNFAAIIIQRQTGATAEAAAAAELSYRAGAVFGIDGGRLALYAAGETSSVKVVIPAGTILTPSSSMSSNVKLRITKDVIVDRSAMYYGTAEGWLQRAQQPAIKSIDIGFRRVDAAGNWYLVQNAANLEKGWYRTDAIVDGTETDVMMEYDGTILYIYPHTFCPGRKNTLKVPASSLVIPEGAKMYRVVHFDNPCMVEGAQSYEVAAELSVTNVDGAWTPNAKAAVENPDGAYGWYPTVQAAVKHVQGTTDYVVLVADSEETVNVSADLYIDLAGNTLAGANVAQGATLYGMDRATNDYNCEDEFGYGSIGAINGNYAVQYKSDVTGSIKRYIAISEETGISFHRIYLGITHTSLKPANVSVGYKAVFAGDQKVQEQVASYGYTLQLGENAPKVVTENGAFDNKDTVTLRIDNYDLKYAEVDLSAAVTVTLKNGTVLTSSSVTRTMRQMVETADDQFDSLTTAQKDALKAMYEDCEIDSLGWAVDNIAAWGEVTVPETGADPVAA